MKDFSFLMIIISSMAGCGVLNKNDKPDIPGKIVFSATDEAENHQIYSMNADGSNIKQLTDWETSSMQPSWSPDGKSIVFATFKDATTLGPSLYIMDADGSNKRPLKRLSYESPNALVGSAPAWSPDGTKIAYQVCTNCELGGGDYEIVVVEVKGTEYDPAQVHAVTHHPASDRNPVWSPDGNHILFLSGRDYYNADTLRFRQDLYIIDSDGTNIQRLTHSGYAGEPVMTSDGKKIAYVSSVQQNVIYIYHTDTQKISAIESGLQLTGNPMWNKLGTQLLVFGKETKNSNPVMRLLKFKNEKSEILETIKLDEQAIGSNYDWYIEQNL